MLGLPTYQAPTSVGVLAKPPSGADEAFYARRASAYARGESKALQREISADAFLFLYKELVRLAGERVYCWPGLDFLATNLETSEGTIKRWMKELENADLIQRRARPGGRTSLTYITAFLAPRMDEAQAMTCEATSDAVQIHPASHGGTTTHTASGQREPDTIAQGADHQHAPSLLFFGAEQEITSDRGVGSDLIYHSIKELNINVPRLVGGVEQHPRQTTSDDDATTMLLATEEVQAVAALSDLQTKPLDELQALSQYLNKQQNVRCRAGLFVWLARQNFGAQLLAGRKQTSMRTLPSSESNASSEHTPLQPRPALLEVWHQVLDLLRSDVPAGEFVTWLKPTCLLELVEHEAYIAVPNVFVRQHIEACFLDMLGGYLEKVVGRSIQLQVVIESSVVSA